MHGPLPAQATRGITYNNFEKMSQVLAKYHRDEAAERLRDEKSKTVTKYQFINGYMKASGNLMHGVFTGLALGQSAKRASLSAADGDMGAVCAVCKKGKASHVMVPCGHLSVCASEGCLATVDGFGKPGQRPTCPCCRVPLQFTPVKLVMPH